MRTDAAGRWLSHEQQTGCSSVEHGRSLVGCQEKAAGILKMFGSSEQLNGTWMLTLAPVRRRGFVCALRSGAVEHLGTRRVLRLQSEIHSG